MTGSNVSVVMLHERPQSGRLKNAGAKCTKGRFMAVILDVRIITECHDLHFMYMKSDDRYI
jgi:hypothetical protein